MQRYFLNKNYKKTKKFKDVFLEAGLKLIEIIFINFADMILERMFRNINHLILMLYQNNSECVPLISST